MRLFDMTGLEIAGAVLKPIYYVYSLAKGLPSKKSDDSFKAPKKSLILIPDTHPIALHWGMAQAAGGAADAIGVHLDFQATNVASCDVRPCDVQIIWPKNIEVVQKIIFARSEDNYIPQRSIGEINITMILRPAWVKSGDDLRMKISIVDQFNNPHPIKVRCRFIGTKGPQS
jgi:hypothetical protein